MSFFFLILCRNFTNTNLKKHLQRYHHNKFEEFEKVDADVKSVQKSKDVGVKKQVTVEHAFGQSKPYSFDHPRSVILHRAIAEMLCVDCLPISVVERLGFRRLLHVLELCYTPCSRTYLSQTLIPDMYTQVMTCVAKRLELVSRIRFMVFMFIGFVSQSHRSLDQ